MKQCKAQSFVWMVIFVGFSFGVELGSLFGPSLGFSWLAPYLYFGPAMAFVCLFVAFFLSVLGVAPSEFRWNITGWIGFIGIMVVIILVSLVPILNIFVLAVSAPIISFAIRDYSRDRHKQSEHSEAS